MFAQDTFKRATPLCEKKKHFPSPFGIIIVNIGDKYVKRINNKNRHEVTPTPFSRAIKSTIGRGRKKGGRERRDI